MKIARISLLLLLACLLLLSCSSSLVSLKYEDGTFYNKGQKLTYLPAPANFDPYAIGEAYAYYEPGKMTLYEIQGLDPKKWLTEEYSGNSTTVFYEDSVTLPTLREMAPTSAFLCVTDELIISIAEITEKDTIQQLIDLYESGEKTMWPMDDATTFYDLRFYSENLYPHLYYTLVVAVFPDGTYLYDRETRECVVIGDILDGYLH